jgi:hypothetical protein
MAATTSLLGLVTPTQGDLSGTWGNTVNNGITEYVDIAVAGTLTLTNDGAVTLANTLGSASASLIVSTLTGAGTVTAQFAIVKVTGTLTVAKVVTGPSYSKTYTVVNSATGGIVTFKASGQTGVSIAVGESAFVYFNGTDYVKVSGTVAVASFQTSLGGLTPSTATTGVVTLAGTLNTTSGGTGLTSFTAGDVPYYASGSVLSKLAIGTAGQFLTSTGTAPQWSTLSGVAVTTFSAGTTGFTPSSATSGAVTLAGTLNVANGGTGLTSLTSGNVPYGNGTSAFSSTSNFNYDGANLGVSSAIPPNTVYPGLFLAYTTNIIPIGGEGGLYYNIYGVGTQLKWQTGGLGGSKFTFGNGAFAWAGNSTGGTANTNATLTEFMRLSDSGNLGIGTSTMGRRLNVAAPTAAGIQFQPTGASGRNYSIFATDSGASVVGALAVFDDTASAYRMVIDSSGNVGIGTTNPSSYGKFAVVGSTSQGSAFVAGGTNAFSLISATSTSGTMYLGVNGTAAGTPIDIGGISDNASYFGSRTNTVTQLISNNTVRATIDTSGNVGIGLTNPGYKLQVAGASNQISIQNPGYGAYLFDVTSGVALAFTKEGTGERARISPNGGFAVGTTSDPGAGAIYATGAITAFFSDKRLKTVSGKIENALDKVAKLSGVYYTFNDTAKSFGYDSDEVHVGVLAQEVEAVLPQIVKAAPFDLDENNNSKSGENYKTVQYERLVPLLIEAINELQAKVKLLENK